METQDPAVERNKLIWLLETFLWSLLRVELSEKSKQNQTLKNLLNALLKTIKDLVSFNSSLTNKMAWH